MMSSKDNLTISKLASTGDNKVYITLERPSAYTLYNVGVTLKGNLTIWQSHLTGDIMFISTLERPSVNIKFI